MNREYQAMLRLLKYCYRKSQNDFLGILLGILSCDIWGDDMPADEAAFLEWERISKLNDDKNLVEKVVAFLKYYESEYSFDLESVIKFINENDISIT